VVPALSIDCVTAFNGQSKSAEPNGWQRSRSVGASKRRSANPSALGVHAPTLHARMLFLLVAVQSPGRLAPMKKLIVVLVIAACGLSLTGLWPGGENQSEGQRSETECRVGPDEQSARHDQCAGEEVSGIGFRTAMSVRLPSLTVRGGILAPRSALCNGLARGRAARMPDPRATSQCARFRCAQSLEFDAGRMRLQPRCMNPDSNRLSFFNPTSRGVVFSMLTLAVAFVSSLTALHAAERHSGVAGAAVDQRRTS
jgi:hypothetical protein